jgi:hypothetical protein
MSGIESHIYISLGYVATPLVSTKQTTRSIINLLTTHLTDIKNTVDGTVL